MRQPTAAEGNSVLSGMARILRLLLFSGLILSCPRPTVAQTWNGNVSDLWSNTSNWTPNTVPNSSSANGKARGAAKQPIRGAIRPWIGCRS